MKQELLEAAKNAEQPGILDEIIYDGDMIRAFEADTINKPERVLDVAISSIHALCSNNAYKLGTPWRKAVSGLDCNGWEEKREEITHYFTHSTAEQDFPTAETGIYLKLVFVGGALYCAIGNHRLLAAKVWLACNYREDAILRGVDCSYRPINPGLKPYFERALKGECKLRYAFIPADQRYSLRKYNLPQMANILCVDTKEGSPELFDITNNRMDKIRFEGAWFNRKMNKLKFSLWMLLKYQLVPSKLIEIMLNEDAVKHDFNIT
jgi:hypothetical protein